MADTRNRILPKVYRTGDETIDRNLDSIVDAFRRLSSSYDDDHEVKADPDDEGHGTLYDKLEGVGITISAITDYGERKVVLTVDDIHYDIPISIPVLLRNGLIPRVMMVRALTFPAGLTGSTARIFTAPTDNGTVNIKKNGGASPVATATLTAGSNAVTLAAAAAFTVAAGDWLSFEPPTTDATAADLSITLKGEMV